MNPEQEEDELLFQKAEVEWTDIPNSMPNSLDELILPVEYPAVSEAPVVARAASLSLFRAILWCLLFLCVTQFLPLVGVFVYYLLARPDIQQAVTKDPGLLLHDPSILPTLIVTGQLTAVLFAVGLTFWKFGKQWPRLIALRLPKLDHLILVLLGMPALFVVIHSLEAVVRYLPDIEISDSGSLKELMSKLVDSTSSWPWQLAVFAIGICPAIAEEFFCRGVLGRGLVGRYGFLPGILITSLLFGALHVEPHQAVLATFMGVVLHGCYVASRSFLIPVLIHFLNNSLAVLSVSKTGNVPLFTSLEETYERNGYIFLFSATMVLATIGLAFYQSRFQAIPLDGRTYPDSVEIPEKNSDLALFREPIPPGTIVLIVLALSGFSAIWWNL
ncbi:CPBP family intramembrane metalloprotease [Telmatocola sphagniphila]|uniref:CPBP family intramembrane metalloprotease n=1 Tax=Telmatocola sphagniphila TaxID=1123043 RepID=A0A8E6EXV1_9BACT|nr:type II CAAX endopeptidase family protein [Telmatocola sphagniphila]QVL32018.1 CPBP family intramembrane metalloprotease [Telmatocola sphagniphila]